MRFFVSHFSQAACTVACLAAIAGTFLLLTGCGSSGHTVALSGQPPALGDYFGRSYVSNRFPAGDKNVNLEFVLMISGENTANGLLRISTPVTQKQVTETAQTTRQTTTAPPTKPFTPGYLDLVGTFNHETRAFNLSGAYLGAGRTTIPVIVTGTLPPLPAFVGGRITAKVDGTILRGAFIEPPPQTPPDGPPAATAPASALSVVSGKGVKPDGM